MRIGRWSTDPSEDEILDELVVYDIECAHIEVLSDDKIYLGLWDGENIIQVYFYIENGNLRYYAIPQFKNPSLNYPRLIPPALEKQRRKQKWPNEKQQRGTRSPGASD